MGVANGELQTRVLLIPLSSETKSEQLSRYTANFETHLSSFETSFSLTKACTKRACWSARYNDALSLPLPPSLPLWFRNPK